MSKIHPESVRDAAPQIIAPPDSSRLAALRHGFAHWVSIIIHPLLFPLVTIFVVGLAITHDVPLTAVLALLSLTLTSLPVALVVLIQVRRGKWSDFDVSRRQQRFALYPFTLACVGLLAFLYYRLSAPAFAVRSILSLGLASVVDGIINLFWKVSAHATTAALCAALLWQLTPGTAWGPTASAGALLVGWSRVELRRHTPGQVLAGWLVGASSAIVALRLGV